MKQLTRTLLVLGGIAQLGGCIITSSDDDGGDDGNVGTPDAGIVVDEVGSFDVAWTLDPGCPEETSAAAVFAMNRATDEVTIDIFNCVDLGGVTAELPLGDYDVWVDITDEAGATLLAQSLAANGVLATPGGVVQVDIPSFPTLAGFFGFTWTLVDGNGAAETCANVGADGVDIIATLAGTSEATVDIFDCTAGEGVTNQVPVGTHTIVVDVLNGEEALGSSVAREETIEFGNELVDIGNFEFTFQ